MSVQITSRISTNARASSGDSNFLNGNVGDWQETTLLARVAVETKTTLSNQITVNTDDTWTLSSGSWASLGFVVGDAIVGTLNYTFSGTNTDLAISVTVTAISGNIMTVDADILGALPVFFIVPSTNGGYTLNWMEVRAAKAMNAAKLEYNQILNSQVGSPSLASELDGSFTVFSANAIGVLNEITPQSGNAVYSVNVALDSYTSGVSIFEITILHAIAGFYDTTTNIQTDSDPSWFTASECFGDAFRLTFFPAAGSPIGAQVSDIVSYTGNTGWFNEDRNSGVDNFTVTSVTYEDSLANALTSIASDEETTIVVRVSSGSAFFDSTNSRFNFGILPYLPIDRTSLSNNSVNALGVLCANTMGVDSHFTHSVTPTVGTIAGFPNDIGAQLDIESYQFEVLSSTELEVTIIVSPNSTLTTLLNSQAVGDRLFSFWVGVAQHSTAYTPAVRVNKMVSGQFLPETVVEESLKGGTDFGIFPREMDSSVDVDVNSVDIVEEDDFHGTMNFVIDKSLRISTAEFGIELYNPSNGSVITMESLSYDLSTQPVSAFGIQEINFTTNRNFNYVDGFKDKLVSLVRNSSLDAGANVGFTFTHPFRFRYEWWLPNSLYNLFYLNTLPLDNINNQWWGKQVGVFSGLDVRYYQKLLIDGVIYKDWKTLDIISYRDAYRVDAGFDGSIAVYSDALYADSLNIGTKDNYLLCDLFAFDDSNPNYIKAELTKSGANFSTDYAEITLEGEDGSGYLSQWKLRSDQTPAANNPIRPLSGETTLKVTDDFESVISECYIDTSLLPSSIVNLKVTAEFCGSSEGGEGETTYFNREMIFGIIGKTPEVEPDTYCSIDETCDYKLPVFADTESTDYYKNDIKGIFRKRTVLESDIEFFLVEEDGTEHALDDNTYGTIFDFDTFTYEPNLKAYQLRWRDVLSTLGDGCYRIKTVVTDLRSNATTFYSCCYELQHYDCQSAHRTVRIESVQKGNFKKLDINFKGIDWLDHLRFEGYFGYELPKHESTINIKTNNSKELNRMDLKSSFKLTSSLVPSICVTQPLWNFHLMASEIYISDYNLDNHRRDYISFPVFFEEVDNVDYFKMNTNATMSLSFSERVIENRVTTCDGDRPLSYLVSGFVWENQCPTVGTKDLTIAIPYAEDDDTSTVTIISNAVGTITSAVTTGLTTVSYTVNASPVTIPFALALTDVLEIAYDAAGSDGTIILSGTYV